MTENILIWVSLHDKFSSQGWRNTLIWWESLGAHRGEWTCAPRRLVRFGAHGGEWGRVWPSHSRAASAAATRPTRDVSVWHQLPLSVPLLAVCGPRRWHAPWPAGVGQTHRLD